eukprot:NP_509302.1 Uncharacterized protein CELE_K09F5.4 [Caenorhabditis elegans]
MEKEGAHNTIINSEMRSTEKSEKRPPPFGMNMFFFSIPLKAMFLFFACMIPTGHQGRNNVGGGGGTRALLFHCPMSQKSLSLTFFLTHTQLTRQPPSHPAHFNNKWVSTASMGEILLFESGKRRKEGEHVNGKEEDGRGQISRIM